MLRELSRCPYCDHGLVSVDDHRSALVVGPAGGAPCPHLAYVLAGLYDDEPRGPAGGTPRPDVNWVWACGGGVRRYGPGDPLPGLFDYLDEFCLGHLSDDEVPGSAPFRVVGGTCNQRGPDGPAAGLFDLEVRPGVFRRAALEGWGVYSPDPPALTAEVGRLAHARYPW